MSLEISVITVEEVGLIVDVVTPPMASAVDVTAIGPAIVIDVAGTGTGFLVDVMQTPALAAVDVTAGDPLAAIVVDIPGSDEDEVIGGTITIAGTAPSSPAVNDVWIDTT